MGREWFGIVAVFAHLRVDTIRENICRGLALARAFDKQGAESSKTLVSAALTITPCLLNQNLANSRTKSVLWGPHLLPGGLSC